MASLPIVCTGRGRGEMERFWNAGFILHFTTGMEILHEKQFLFEGRIAQTSILQIPVNDAKKISTASVYSQVKCVTALSSTVQQNLRYFHHTRPKLDR